MKTILLMSNQDEYMIKFVIIGLLILIILLGLLREVICWFYKINERSKQNAEIIRLLKKIAGEYDNTL